MIQVFQPKMNVDAIMPQMREVLESGWIGLGPKTAQLEKEISEYIGGGYVTCLNSCTSALHLALKATGSVKPSVISSPITFVSTNHVLRYEKFSPHFCDVEHTTGNLDMVKVEELLKTRQFDLVMVVHLGGYPADMQRLNWLAKKYEVNVIEDCAHAFGSTYRDGRTKIGNSENLCCFSFHAVKNCPMGDGGAIVTRDKGADRWLKQMRWLGINKDTSTRAKGGYSWEYDVEEIGYKYHMNDITAVIGLEQLKTIEEDNVRRRDIALYYRDHIKNATIPQYESIYYSSCHFYPMFFQYRDKVYDALVAAEIFPGMHYKSNHRYKPYSDCPRTGLAKAKWYEDHQITLPMHLELTNENLEYIVSVVNGATDAA